MPTLCEKDVFRITAAYSGKRLDVSLAALMALSRTGVQRLIEYGGVAVNGRITRQPSFKLKGGDEISASRAEPEPIAARPQPIKLDVLYEDGDIIVVNKQQGLVVHPAEGHADGTLVNALLSHCGGSLSGINGELRPGIVHRIDKDTSGVIVCAKNDFAHNHLAEQLSKHAMTRLYRAVVHGGMKEASGTIDKPIGRSLTDRKKFAVTPGGKRAVTHWRELERLNGHTLVECRLETGRTHQIRVHMAFINHPVFGDPVYGIGNRLGVERQVLHAAILGFIHPRTGSYMQFAAPDPPEFSDVVAQLGKRGDE
jgi:23S rRNA pseudouridine1911/1915/1917 synthase